MPSRKALVVGPRAPDVDRGSGGKRLLDFVDFLQDSDWSVTFAAGGWAQRSLPRHVKLDSRYSGVLQQRGIPTYAGLDSRTKSLLADAKFDLALLTYFHVAESWIPAIRTLSPATKIIADNFDLNFLRTARQRFFQREHPGEAGFLDEEFAWEMIRELNVYASSDMVLAVSDKEAALVNDLSGDPLLARTVPDGENLEPSTIPLPQRRGVVFTGTFLHPPNLDAAMYLCSLVLPQLSPDSMYEHPIHLVGDGLDRVQRELGLSSSHVLKVGWVPDAIPYLRKARVAVMPLPYGAGTKRKVIQALMLGTPSVATSMAVEGLDLQHGEHILIADDSASFARAISRLLDDSDLWHRLARQGREHMTAIRHRNLARAAFGDSVEAALARPPKGAHRAQSLELYRPLPGSSSPRINLRLHDRLAAFINVDSRHSSVDG